MSYTYNSFAQAVAIYMALPNAAAWTPTSPTSASPWPNFDAALPSIIDYAEQRCYRELDLLNSMSAYQVDQPALTRLASFTPTDGSQPILIIEDVNVILGTGERVPLTPVSRQWLDVVYGGPQTADMPEFFAMRDDATVALGPWPDQDYTIEFLGQTRPVPLYGAEPDDGTQTTFLTQWLPDLFLAAAMVSAAGYQKNFGSQSDNPQMAMSWETQFNSLLGSAKSDEVRKKFHGWQALSSEANPPPTPQPVPGG